MGKTNTAWHKEHPMPEKPTLEQRVAWHKAHAAACGCRAMPENIRLILENQKKQKNSH